MRFNYLGLGSLSVLQLSFLGKSDPIFPLEKFPLGQRSVQMQEVRDVYNVFHLTGFLLLRFYDHAVDPESDERHQSFFGARRFVSQG